MKILSSYKDYYDYYVGIYGEDPLLILDRRKHVQPALYGRQKIKIFLCDFIIEGYYDGNTVYWGKDLLKVGKYARRLGREIDADVHIDKFELYKGSTKHSYGGFDVSINPYKDKNYTNQKQDCPIIMEGNYKDLLPYPKLAALNIGSYITAENMYKGLCSWLSAQKTFAENRPDTRTNDQKIAGKGFESKTSFRPNMK